MDQENLPTEHLVKSDKRFLLVLWLLFVMSLGLAPLYGTLQLALAVGLPVALIPSALIVWKPGALVTRMSVAVALMLFCALHIHQARGMAELHFGIFVLLAFLVCYRDWRVIIVAALVAAVHHLSFNYLQQWGYEVICFTNPGLGIVLTHAAYVVIEALVLSYVAVMLQQEARKAMESGVTLQHTLDAMRVTADGVRQGIQAIVIASKEISAGSANLSSHTDSQVSSLREAAGSIEQFTSTVNQNADHAKQANQLVSSASSVAVKGGEVVTQVVDTMDSIKNSSHKIVDIISLIDGIAFQTNILALNAAVEAARAGEHGRSFAIVATEVRTLAQRSASAAKDIKILVEDTVQKVDAGSVLVGEAGQTMELIVASVKHVAGIISEITVASQEQSDGIRQINQTMLQMDEMTRQNAALVEQSNVAVQSMHGHANRVSDAMDGFDQGEGKETFVATADMSVVATREHTSVPLRHSSPSPILAG